MTNDDVDDSYGSVNENDSSCLAGVKLSAVITLHTQCDSHKTEKIGQEIMIVLHYNILSLCNFDFSH